MIYKYAVFKRWALFLVCFFSHLRFSVWAHPVVTLNSQADGYIDLYNDLPAGLIVRLGPNCDQWNTYDINPKPAVGEQVPGKLPPGWSSWNVYDQKGAYFGSYTLKDNASTYPYSMSLDYTLGQKPDTKHQIFGSTLKCEFNPGAAGICRLSAESAIGAAVGPFPFTPVALPAHYQNSDEKVVLSVSGNRIVNNHGQIVTLKGLVRPSLEWNLEGEHLSEEDIARMAAWGINTLRINLNQVYWNQSSDRGSASYTKGSYRQIINAMVQTATQNHMAVILDLHWTHVANGQSRMANRDSLSFWKEIALEYKDFGTVIFELFNEPTNSPGAGDPGNHSLTPQVWMNGDDTYAGFQEMISAIRSVGAENICIINGLDWGYDLSFITPDFHVSGENIMYGSHPYEKTGSPIDFESSIPKYVLDNYPVIFTEFGLNEAAKLPEAEKIYSKILDFINRNHINYTGFAWWVEAANPQFPSLISGSWEKPVPQYGGTLIYDDIKTKHPVSAIDLSSYL